MRPTGHVIDVTGDTERVVMRPIASMPGLVGASVPDEIDWRSLSPVVLDQQRSEACVWHAVAMALYLRGQRDKVLGLSNGIPMPSTMQPWVLAQWERQRRLGVPAEVRAATNTGSSVSAGLAMLETFGIVSAERWPLDERLDWGAPELPGVTFDLPLDLDVAAAEAKLTGDYGANGENFPLVARAASAAGHFPVQAFDVDETFFDIRPGADEYRGTEGRPVIGRHMMANVGYRPGWLLFRGSYSKTWGTDGHVWISDAYSASPQARDGAVITAAPRIR